MSHPLFAAYPSGIPEQVWREPLPFMDSQMINRWLCRTLTMIAKRSILGIEGDLTVLSPENDPFIIVMNHNQRYESVLLPGLLAFYRRGRFVHFMADWNYLLMPGVASLYRRSQAIIVTGKDARPKFLNVFKPLFQEKQKAYDRALARVRAGSSLGIFPEGTINRDPRFLLRGRSGAARLSIEAGVPVLPIGIRFPFHGDGQSIPDGAKMVLAVGALIQPPNLQNASHLERDVIEDFHGQIMRAVSSLSGKAWDPTNQKRRSNGFQR